MDAKELREIDRFLTITGASDLFSYYGIPQTADRDMAELAIQDRREWAQTQQANPKYRPEALWVIRGVALARKALIQDVAAYREHVKKRSLEPRLRQLEDIIQGAQLAGSLTPKSKEAIRKKGQALGVPFDVLDRRLAELDVDRDQEDAEDEGLALVEVEDDPSTDSVSGGNGFSDMPDFLAKDQGPEDELKDIVRGLLLQGMRGAGMEKMVLRRGERLGLDESVVRRIIAEVVGGR
jgi:hypothetical protein